MNGIIETEPDALKTGEKPNIRKLRFSITIITLITLVITALIPRSLTLMAPYIREQLGIDERQFGFLVGVLVIGSLVITLPLGNVLGRLNTRRTFGTMMIAIGLGMFALAFQNSFFGFIVILLIIGIIKAGVFPMVNRVIAEHFESGQRGRITGFLFAAIPLGGFLGALVLPALAEALDWRAGYHLLGILAFIGGLITLILLPRTKTNAPSRKAVTGYKSLKTTAFIVLCVTYGLFVLSESTEAFITLFLVDEVKISAVLAGTFYGMIQLTAIMGRVYWGFLADRFFSGNRWWLLTFINGITAISLLLLIRLNEGSPNWFIAIVMIGFGISAASAGGVLFTIIGDVVGVNSVAIATAAVMFIASIADASGPMLYSLLLRFTNSYQRTLSVYVVVTLLTTISFVGMALHIQLKSRKSLSQPA